MKRARRHQRLSSALAFALLALVAELLGHRLLPVPARGREARSCAAARAPGLAFCPRAHGRTGGAPPARGRRQTGRARPPRADRPLAAPLADGLPLDLALLPRAGRRGASRVRALAA